MLEVGINYYASKNYKVVNNASRKYKTSKYTSGDIGLTYSFHDWFEGKNIMSMSKIQNFDGNFNNYIDDDIADKRYKTIKLNFQREQPLPNNFSFTTNIVAGHSNNVLLDAEKFEFGGPQLGRGYSGSTLKGNKKCLLHL